VDQKALSLRANVSVEESGGERIRPEPTTRRCPVPLPQAVPTVPSAGRGCLSASHRLFTGFSPRLPPALAKLVRQSD
jgi:hypothetical protein